MGPANNRISSFVSQALAPSSGGASLSSGARSTAGAVRRAASALGGIDAAPPIKADIGDVIKTLNALGTDLTTLAGARGADISPAIAAVVADAGRESAADAVVRLDVVAATTPHAPVGPIPTSPVPVTTTASTTIARPTPTTIHRTTTTTRRTKVTTSVP